MEYTDILRCRAKLQPVVDGELFSTLNINIIIPGLRLSSSRCDIAFVMEGTPPGVERAWLLIASPGGVPHDEILRETETSHLRLLWFCTMRLSCKHRADKKSRPTTIAHTVISATSKRNLVSLLHENHPAIEVDKVCLYKMLSRLCPASLRRFEGADHLWIAL